MIDWIENHKLIRRLALIWSCSLITWVVIQVFTDISQITSAVVGALSVVIGILASVIGFYQYQRGKEDG